MQRLLTVILVLMLSEPALSSDFVAGSEPDQRPAHAPSVQFYAKPPAWYAQALRGVSQPFPPSFRFLEHQGAWYTPFNRPGMTGPYDIRHWHQR